MPLPSDSSPEVRDWKAWWGSVRRALTLSSFWIVSAYRSVLGRDQRYNVFHLELAESLGGRDEDEGRFWGLLRPPTIDFLTLLALLKWVRKDPRLELVHLTIDRVDAGWGRLDELRRAISALRGAGKTVWAHLLEPGLKEYYLASAADKVLLAPSALLDVTGIATEVTFVKGALEKLGIEAQITQIGRYKSLGEVFTRRSMSAPHREMVESILGDLYAQIIEGIAATRKIERARLADLLGQGPHAASDALKLGLVDGLAYEDEIQRQIEDQVVEPATVNVSKYRRMRGFEMRRELVRTEAPKIGLMELSGPIKMGESVPGASGIRATGVRSFARALGRLGEDESIKGVVLRVESPGGSGVASDLMWREVLRLKEKKPVVVSFGEVAASGGYYVGMAGSLVLAAGTTLTGSIGVLAGKAVLKGLYNQLGVKKEIVSCGGNPARHSDYLPLDEESTSRMLAEAESFYDDFVAKVAQCRRMDPKEAGRRAQGRVWSGRQALDHGLVDEAGGVEQALDRLKELVGIPEKSLVAVERLPHSPHLLRLPLNLHSRPLAGGPALAVIHQVGWLADAFSGWWRGEKIFALAGSFPGLASTAWGAGPRPSWPSQGGSWPHRLLGRVVSLARGRLTPF